MLQIWNNFSIPRESWALPFFSVKTIFSLFFFDMGILPDKITTFPNSIAQWPLYLHGKHDEKRGSSPVAVGHVAKHHVSYVNNFL